ncbi:unnamed protein product, partial [Nesidiocoris tenuis]
MDRAEFSSAGFQDGERCQDRPRSTVNLRLRPAGRPVPGHSSFCQGLRHINFHHASVLVFSRWPSGSHPRASGSSGSAAPKTT